MDDELIVSDFAAFADPIRPVTIEDNFVRWVRDRKELTAELKRDDSGEAPKILFDGQLYGYREFIASVHMADLRGLSEMMESLLSASIAKVGPAFVQPQVQIDDQSAVDVASQALARALSDGRELGRTQLVFLKGRAGDGKSTLLVEMTHTSAKAFLRGERSDIFFYINAQGTALSRIDDVIAKTTQDFRARFTYHALPTLTRLRLVIPIIDGFDELLGVGGYKDAFSSLALFVTRLRGEGAVIASARSTFYEYTDFGAQAARFSTDENPLFFKIVPVTLLPWRKSECENFLEKKRSSISLADLEKTLGDRKEEVLSSPFLFSQLVELGPAIVDQSGQSHMVRAIVESLVKREMQEKLLDPQGKPLLAIEQHFHFLGMVAEEMWWQETRELDDVTLETLSSLAAEEFGLQGPSANRFISRVPSYGLLQRFESPSRVSFRHEFYFAFFLGMRIASAIAAEEELTPFFTRGSFSAVIGDEVALSLSGRAVSDLPRLISDIKVNVTSAKAPEVCRANLGILFWGLLYRIAAKCAGACFKAGLFSGLTFERTVVSNVRFVDCLFDQCDFSSARWTNVAMVECKLSLPFLTPDTRFEVTGLRLKGDVAGIQVRVPGQPVQDAYSLSDVGAVLQRIGVTFEDKVPKQLQLSPKANGLISELNVLLKVPERTLYFSSDDYALRGVNFDRDLKTVTQLLVKHELMTEALQKHRKGKRKLFRLTQDPVAIRAGQTGTSPSKNVQAFWQEVLGS
jgi:hypothetical protein